MRARHLYLHPKTVERLLRLKKEAEQEGEVRVARRLHATLLNDKGKTSGEIADVLNVARSRVSEWLALYESYGMEALLEGHRMGRPPRLSVAQKEELAGIVDRGPMAYGFLSGVWTSVMITEVIRDAFGVHYDPRHVRRILSELNFSVQKPKRVLAKADPVQQNRWRRYTYPRIKKKPNLREQP
jgi:transposase